MPAPQNLPPNSNPNILANPGHEPVPEVNKRWETEAEDVRAINTAVTEMRVHQQEINRLNALDPQHPSYAATIKHYQTNVWPQREQSIAARLDTAFSQGNPTVLLARLDCHLAAAHGENAAALAAQQKADKAAADANHRLAIADVLFMDNAIAHGTNHEATKLANTHASKSSVTAGNADRKHSGAAQHVENITGYADRIDRYRTHYADRQRVVGRKAELAIEEATNRLDRWPFDTELQWHGEADVRVVLADIDNMINNDMGASDTMRAVAQGEYVRLRYRLEQRVINRNAINVQPHLNTATMESDRGILLPTGTTIYEDGSSARPEPDGQGGLVRIRRRPIGEQVTQLTDFELNTEVPPSQPISVDGHGRQLDVEGAFVHWERNRTPESAQQAHRALVFEVAQDDIIDDHYTAEIAGIDHRIATTQDRIQAIQQVAAAENRALNATENQEIANIMAQDRRDIARRPNALNDRELIRERANVRKYRKHLLEAGNRVYTPRVATQGLLRRTVVATREFTPPPMLLRDGNVVANTVVNGHRAPNWCLSADGRSARQDPTTGRYLTYAANGRRI
ncbi:MAG TPA: hypothetical protein VLA92_03465 [Candidatus Saccharimonadales bacterium]|nr:hypothetical protein [Candidatus Saccharimonadales bacterium]